MEILTETIKAEIKSQFKTVRSFSQQIGIPQTTVSSILKNGVGGTGYETIVKICKSLDIGLVNYNFPIHIDDDSLKMVDIYNKLDERGKHSVRAILKVESERCNKGVGCHEL